MLKLLFSVIPSSPLKLYGVLGIILIVSTTVGFHLFGDSHVRSQRDTAIRLLAEYKLAQTELANTQRLKIEIAKLEGKKNAAIIETDRLRALEKLGLATLDREKLKLEMRTLNEKFTHSQMRLADTKHNYDERLRAESINSRSRMPKESPTTEGLAESGRECDPTSYRNLYQACQLTTTEFNAARAALDNDTAAVGRDE